VHAQVHEESRNISSKPPLLSKGHRRRRLLEFVEERVDKQDAFHVDPLTPLLLALGEEPVFKLGVLPAAFFDCFEGLSEGRDVLASSEVLADDVNVPLLELVMDL